MIADRRRFTAALAAAALAPACLAAGGQQQGGAMFGMIGRMVAVAGKRDELVAILLGGTGSMPGCLSYVVARDPSDADALWITEVWDSQASHKASLQLPAVQQAIAQGKPLIARFDQSIVTEPVGGYGLKTL
jgi:quinol monooxygenase YgiN